MKFENFINRYSLSKTLKFSLIPIGNTLKNFEAKKLLEEDEQRSVNCQKVKKYIDKYHKHCIEKVLAGYVPLKDLLEYAELYFSSDKGGDNLEAYEDSMRRQIAAFFAGSKVFASPKELIDNILPEFLTDEKEIETVRSFKGFSTYFTGFYDSRKNIYTPEAKANSIAFRCINENLPKFLDNVKSFRKIADGLSKEALDALDSEYEGLCGATLEDIFTVDYFGFVLSQSGIDRYNTVIGGYSTSDGGKIKGINEYVNLHNQVCGKEERLPQLKILYKQILSDSETLSFIPEKFKSDKEVLDAVNGYMTETLCLGGEENDVLKKIVFLFSNLEQYNRDGIYIKNDTALTSLSKRISGKWNMLKELWDEKYESSYTKNIKNRDTFEAERDKAYRVIRSFSLSEISNLCDVYAGDKDIVPVEEYYSERIAKLVGEIRFNYERAKSLFTAEYSEERTLARKENDVTRLKDLLDSVKDLEEFMKSLAGSGKESNKDEVFYGEYSLYFNTVREIDKLYDKVRNYVTQKPYSKEQIKLNFENFNFLGGWDRNKEKDYRSVLFRKGENFFLGIMDKENSKVFEEIPAAEADEGCYEKMVYKLLPGPNKMLPKVFFSRKGLEVFTPSAEIVRIYKSETFKKGPKFSLEDCHTLIDFYKESIEKHADWSRFEFKFKPTEEYANIGDFYRDVKEQGYKVSFVKISDDYINNLVDSGALYLFQIYNKDFSPYSKGAPNLHTLYFKMLFDEKNLENPVFQLNGGAEMFYRPASIKNPKITHPANVPIANKNPDNPKKESVFDYDLIKDKRFTEPQFSFHVPIGLNFKAEGENFLNNKVRFELKNSADNYVIGVERGERHLLYVCVSNGAGEIVEQYSLNEIGNVNYHSLLDRKEKERDAARKNWSNIENIKELKDGYMSQAVHKICELVMKYNAVIAMEDLSGDFKRSRIKVEKQVYQKFEKALTDKLRFLVDKNIVPETNGGLLRAYQLANKDGFANAKQDGIIFYIPSYFTSNIDPATGFVDFLRPKYSSIADSADFFGRFNFIRYNSDKDYFEFGVNYDNFPSADKDYRKNWVICTYGERVHIFRNPEKNNAWDSKKLFLADEFKALFDEFKIDYAQDDIKNDIIHQISKEFFIRLTNLLSLTLQMRNTGIDTVDDFFISPVKSANGDFFDSRDSAMNKKLPANPAANGAYNIARKALWAIERLKEASDEEVTKTKISLSNVEWLEFVQKDRD